MTDSKRHDVQAAQPEVIRGRTRVGFVGCCAPGRVELLWVCLFAVSWSSAGLAGCSALALNRRETGAIPSWQKCVLAEDASLEEVVAHLNRNVDRIQSLRCSNINLKLRGMPLTGDLVAQKGGRFRFQVSSLAGQELDLGSNDDVAWYWARLDDPPALLYYAHEERELAQQTMDLPFDPLWMMETLSLEPLNPSDWNMERHPDPRRRTVSLVSRADGPHGGPLYRQMIVDTCHGRVIQHSLVDPHGQAICRATLKNYVVDKQSAAEIPRTVTIEWPARQMEVSMQMKQLVVNSPSLPSRAWDMPHMPRYRQVNLAEPQGPPGRTVIR